MQMAYAAPKEIVNKKETAEKISEILNLDGRAVEEKISDSEDMFEILKHKLADEEINKIKELKAAGIHLMPENFRFYPGGELASQLIGFVGSDGGEFRGMYGLEAYFEKELKGEPGSLSQERDARDRGLSISDRELQPAKNGDDFILTVNHTAQYETEKILRETVERHKADSGTIIAIEVKTGKILAMANFPGFNP